VSAETQANTLDLKAAKNTSFSIKAVSKRVLRIAPWVVGLGLVFAIYTSGLSKNPRGFFMDESCTAYNAYLLAHTGAGEFGPRFPFFFEVYRGEYVQYYHPVDEYLLALVFLFRSPSILLVRMYSTFLMFSACVLLGFLAKRISGSYLIGCIIGAFALVTPWFFEVGRLAWEAHLVPLLTILFLHALYHAQRKEKWSLLDIALLVLSLGLLTYCYASGRALGPLMAAGLVFFTTTRKQIIAVATTWILYAVTLLPAFLFGQQHPGVLMKRFIETSYLRTTIPLGDNLNRFIDRFLEDQSLIGLLLTGDLHSRHHLQGSGGAFFYSIFAIVVIGFVIVVARRRNDPWWRFVLYGLAAAIVPGAITTWPTHALRLLAWPVFLLLLAVPGLEWFLARKPNLLASSSAEPAKADDDRRSTTESFVPRPVLLSLLAILLGFCAVETYWFQTVYRREGPKREGEFDVDYKKAYDAAVNQSSRPIYLEDGRWGPGYIHALWYATLEKRPTSEFTYLPSGSKAPSGAVVISTSDVCEGCETITRAYVYHVYRAP